MSSPRVSCVIACHDYGRFVGAAIESVLGQTAAHELAEIIVVDDGSTDDTPAVLDRYGDAIRVIRTPHAGLLSTINTGLAEARGDLVAFCSADDMWTPHKLERQTAYLDARPQVGLVHSDMEMIDTSGTVIHPSFLAAFGVPAVDGAVLPVLLQRNIVSGGPAMVRAELLPVFHPIDPAVAAWEDWWMAFKIAQVAEIGLIREPLYRYRRHPANMNLGSTGERLLGHVRAELPFRRHMLTSMQPGQVSTAELYAGLRVLLQLADRVAAATGEPVTAILPVNDVDRTLAGARLRGSETLPSAQDAAFELVAALAHDPWADEPMRRLQQLSEAA